MMLRIITVGKGRAMLVSAISYSDDAIVFVNMNFLSVIKKMLPSEVEREHLKTKPLLRFYFSL